MEPTLAPVERHILIVEDDATTRHSLALLLHRAGYAVDTCADGESACTQLAATPYDLLLVDLVLADAVDGLAVVAQAARLATPPTIVVLTGFGTHASQAAASGLGIAAYLLKPCRPEELLATLAGVQQLPARPAAAALGDAPR